MRRLMNILVTGGAGFIGANFIRLLFGEGSLKSHTIESEFKGRIINLDALTYAGNAANLKEIDKKFGGGRFFFEHGDICDQANVERIFQKYNIDTVVHFAAESHVDRSILSPKTFTETNVIGTFNLLETAKKFWEKSGNSFGTDVLFHHISTDEVYGSLGETGYFIEATAYAPRSPYSASKAASNHMVMAYFHTYGLPVTISNCSNNYGPYQFPEKFIPLMILNMIDGKPFPVYGDGKNIRDWLYVEDHNAAVWAILQKGRTGETYNIGGDNQWENIKLLNALIDILAKKTGQNAEKTRASISYIKDRPGHDRRYAIDCSKIKKELEWKQKLNIEEGLEHTVDWYLTNPEWIENVRSGEYQNWMKRNYIERQCALH